MIMIALSEEIKYSPRPDDRIPNDHRRHQILQLAVRIRHQNRHDQACVAAVVARGGHGRDRKDLRVRPGRSKAYNPASGTETADNNEDTTQGRHERGAWVGLRSFQLVRFLPELLDEVLIGRGANDLGFASGRISEPVLNPINFSNKVDGSIENRINARFSVHFLKNIFSMPKWILYFRQNI